MGSEEMLFMSILEDYRAIRHLYLNGTATQNPPPYAANSLKFALPEWTVSNFENSTCFWESVEQWQMLCNTVQGNQQMMLSSDCNEIMVDAAWAKGGPLKLPIHMEDLPVDVRREVQDLEVQAQEDFISMG